MQASARGFSLIELLVVIFIIGVLIGSVTLSVDIIGDPEQEMAGEAERLLELARLAEDRAIMTGEPVGLVLLPPRLSEELEATWQIGWQRYRRGQWLEAEAPLETSALPQNLELSLEVEGQQVDFSQMEADNEQGPQPSVVFYPGGEVTPFELTVFDAAEVDQQIVLTSRRTGTVEILEPDEVLL